MKSGGSVNNYTSGLVSTLMENGKMQKHLEYYRTEYKVSGTSSKVPQDKLIDFILETNGNCR